MRLFTRKSIKTMLLKVLCALSTVRLGLRRTEQGKYIISGTPAFLFFVYYEIVAASKKAIKIPELGKTLLLET